MSFESGCNDEVTITRGCPTQAGFACVGGCSAAKPRSRPQPILLEEFMHPEKPAVTSEFSSVKTVCILLLCCAAMAISAPAQTLTTLASFDGSNGLNPDGSLLQATDGNFYGTTSSGSGNLGTVFKMTPSGTLTTLYEFCLQSNCPDGAAPTGGLVQ